MRSPLTWIVAVVAIVRVVGIGWGLPSTDGWDNDGVAPRDFIPGLVATFTPGSYYTYPPVHLALLAILTSPIAILIAIHAEALTANALVHEALKVPYMTAFAYVARAVSLGMSLGIVLFAARIAEEMRAMMAGLRPPDANDDPRVRLAGWATAAFVGTNASLTYYAHTSNLDVPYLFWGSWAILVTTRAVARSEPRRLRGAFALAILAIGTKDQAYALFLFSVPVALGLWLKSAGAEARRELVRQSLIALGLSIVIFAVVDAVLANPSGFRARVGFLTGSASQDYAEYERSWSGRWQILVHAAHSFDLQYSQLASPLIVVGLVRAARALRQASQKLAVAIFPLLVAASFTVAFNFTARRTDARFFLSQAVALGIYGGLGIEWVISLSTRALRVASQAAASVAIAASLFRCISVDANLLSDPRYDAERWLRAHAHPDDTIEIYGHNVYQPRLAEIARVIRVGGEPLAQRNPLPGVEEVVAPFDRASEREARFIVVATAWVWRYLPDPEAIRRSGRVMAPTQQRRADDTAAVGYFTRLAQDEEAFKRAHESRYDDRVFPIIDVHGTTTRQVWIFERTPR